MGISKYQTELETLVVLSANAYGFSNVKCTMVVGACYGKRMSCQKTFQIKEDVLQNCLHEALVLKLNKLGGIGTLRNGNSLGYCAEIHAADNLLKQLDYANIKIRLKDIHFSNAYRPRTLMPYKHYKITNKPYCQNCIDTFEL